MTSERRGLGRGLSALIPAAEEHDGRLRELDVEVVDVNPRQPRDVFDEERLDELAASIRQVGVLQPILVRQGVGGRYELVAGERRLRAAKRAGLERIPAVIRETADGELLREALIENIHRTDLNPLEEAAAYRQLLDDFDATHDELAERLGKSRSSVSNTLRLLSLPPGVQRRLAAGILSAGHARALLALSTAEEQEKLAERIVAEGLSVRAVEEIVRLRLTDAVESEDTTPVRAHERGTGRMHAPGLADLEERLSDALMTRVQIRMGSRTGRMSLEFTSVDDLERIVEVIARGLQMPIPVQEQPL
jgi:ParB family transcriptional regulator, chromosome partitioning protein